jgi:hypothetical protein
MKRLGLIFATVIFSWCVEAQTNTNQFARPQYYSSAPQVSPDLEAVRRMQRTNLVVVTKPKAEYSGALVKMSRARTPSEFGQLFNPFAPASYGNGLRRTYAWNPVAGAAPLPHAFIDPMTHEPVGITLISIGR